MLNRDVNGVWEQFLQHYNEVVELCVPEQPALATRSKLKPKWMSQRVLTKIREKEISWARYRQRRDRVRYRKYCNKSILKRAETS